MPRLPKRVAALAAGPRGVTSHCMAERTRLIDPYATRATLTIGLVRSDFLGRASAGGAHVSRLTDQVNNLTMPMPRLPILGTGLMPMIQWLVIPPLVLWFVRR